MQDPTVRPTTFVADSHSYGNPQEVRVRHIDLDWTLDFAKKVIAGSATLSVESSTPATSAQQARDLVLDTRRLKIEKVEVANGSQGAFTPTTFKLAPEDAVLGSALTIALPKGTARVRIHYTTSPEASGLQWLEPAQTAGGKQPFMFSQAQAIHARSFIPLQDSPQVRVTYSAQVHVPKGMMALMSAEGNAQSRSADGVYRFKMTQAIPSYLIAIAVGDLEFRTVGKRTGVYAEPAVIAGAAAELDDTEQMIVATEGLYGPYRWGRYDLLILPPSFPFGGMENPRLTFATPTILAGDKSLVSLIAHELAHSWSGNLVTNATWNDFWLNEGFTVYTERRILEAVYGVERREMEAVLGRSSLLKELAALPASDQRLFLTLQGRDPDEGLTAVAYEKGALFLRRLEELVGRPRFDAFLRGYFEHFAFQSLNTEQFLAYLETSLLAAVPNATKQLDLQAWVFDAGLPTSAPNPSSQAFAKAKTQALAFVAGKVQAAAIECKGWSTHEWLHFLDSLPAQGLGAQAMTALDRQFHFTQSGNSEIAFEWLLLAIRNDYTPAYPRLESFLQQIGRRKFVKPLFEELVKTPAGKARAAAIYKKARPGYHPITASSIDAVMQ